MERNGQFGGFGVDEESRVDTRRYLGALKRNRGLIALIVGVITIVVLVISLILPKQYSATATIVYNSESSLIGPPDAESTQRQLSTLGTLFTTPRTEKAAAEEVSGQTQKSIDEATSVTVAAEANLIHVSAEDSDPVVAAEIANAVSRSFLAVQREQQRENLVSTQADLEEQIENLKENEDSEEQIGALQNRINHLEVQAASAGGELSLGEPASTPDSPSSPQPVRNTVIAFFAAIFLGVLIALGRDQLAPGLSDPREVGRLLRAPVLAGIPYVGKRFGRNRASAPVVEHESYQTLSASVQAMLPPGNGTRVMLMTSALHAEGKSTATSRLGRALAQAGHKTLLVSGDLRWPQLHHLFNAPREPGLVDLLGRVNGGESVESAMGDIARAIPLPPLGGFKPAPLHLITSGTANEDPSGLLSGSVTENFFNQLKGFDYDYVLVDGPPSLGVADVQPLVTLADDIVLVVRLDRVKVADLLGMQEMLARLAAEAFGVVVIGARVNVSPYYLGGRSRITIPSASDEPPKPLAN